MSADLDKYIMTSASLKQHAAKTILTLQFALRGQLQVGIL